MNETIELDANLIETIESVRKAYNEWMTLKSSSQGELLDELETTLGERAKECCEGVLLELELGLPYECPNDLKDYADKFRQEQILQKGVYKAQRAYEALYDLVYKDLMKRHARRGDLTDLEVLYKSTEQQRQEASRLFESEYGLSITSMNALESWWRFDNFPESASDYTKGIFKAHLRWRSACDLSWSTGDKWRDLKNEIDMDICNKILGVAVQPT